MERSDRRNALGAMLGAGMAGMTAAGPASAKAAKDMPKDVMAKQMDELLSRAQIQEVLMAYARGNDRVDEALIRSCFWPESTHKHGRFEGKSSDFVGFAMKIITGLKFTAHHISNVSIQVNGDRALSECYYLAHHRRDRKEGGEEDAWFEGRYLDDFERRNGVWKIIRRRGLADYNAAPTPAPTPYGEWPAGQHSLRYPDDDYYKMQSAFRGS